MRKIHKCVICGITLQQGNICPACKDWIERGIPPRCRNCGEEADQVELKNWERKRGFEVYFGAGRYLCKKCRPNKQRQHKTQSQQQPQSQPQPQPQDSEYKIVYCEKGGETKLSDVFKK